MKLTKRFFRRSGDSASSRGSHERVNLPDGTQMFINVEIVFYPRAAKKVSWYVSIASQDMNGKHSGDWNVSADNSFVKPFISKARANCNLLAFIPWKQRQKIIAGWLKKSLTP